MKEKSRTKLANQQTNLHPWRHHRSTFLQEKTKIASIPEKRKLFPLDSHSQSSGKIQNSLSTEKFSTTYSKSCLCRFYPLRITLVDLRWFQHSKKKKKNG